MQPARSVRQWVQSRASAVPEEKKLSRDALSSLFIHFFFQLGNSMSGVFLNLYLWRLTHNLWINGMYNILSFAVTPGAFALAGWLAKKKDRMVTLRIGIALISAFYLTVVVLQEKVATYYAAFALFGGVASAFYWTAYLILMYDVSTGRNRIRYLSLNMIFFTLATLAGPASAGYVISLFEGLGGYVFTFSLSFAMFAVSAAGSLRIKAKPTRRKPYYLKYGLLLMRKERDWLHALCGFFMLGLLQGVMLFLPNILLFRTLPREDMVGYFGVLFSTISIATGMYMSRYARETLAKHYLVIAAVGLTGGSCLLLLNMNLWTVLGFIGIYSIFSPLQANTLTTSYYGTVDRLPLKGELRIESVVVRELFLNVGRVMSIFALLGMAASMNPRSLAELLILLSVFQFALAVFVKHPPKQKNSGCPLR